LAYEATATAEAAGANIEALLAKLELAGEYLSEAQVRFKVCDYESALMFAEDCSTLVEGLADQATRLSIDAKKAEDDGLFLTAAVSGIGLALFLLLAFLGWRVLKRRYLRQVLEMQPEVEEPL
jgi:hypothetical protein